MDLDPPWQPRFRTGDRVRLISAGLFGVVIEIDHPQSCYVVMINHNSNFRVLCTDGEITRVDSPK